MTLAHLILLAINLSMALVVFALGLNASLADATSLFRRPGLLLRSILSMNVLMFVFAVAAAALFDLPQAIKIAIVALAASPVPPILPTKQEKAGGAQSYTIGLLVAAAVIGIVLVPLSIELLGAIFGTGVSVSFRSIASVVLSSIIMPLAVGIAVKAIAPAIAARYARPVSMVGTILLVAACLPVLFKTLPLLWAMIGNGVIGVLLLFTVTGLVIGHALGGPDPDDRTVLALATAARHPGVAMAIAGATFPDEKGVLVVVLYHLLLGAIFCIPYVTWRKRRHAAGLVQP